MNEDQIRTLMEQAVSNAEAVGWQRILLAVLDWPFLLFLFLILFVLVFRKKIVGILERGDIQIAWGRDRHIKLRELSDGIDAELDPIRDELAQLRDELAQLREEPASVGVLAPSEGKEGPETGSPDRIQDAMRRMTEGLRSTKYRWRSIGRLASIAGVPEDHALDILRSNPDVVLSVGKSGNQIARLRGR